MDPDDESKTSYQGRRPWWYHRKCFVTAAQFHEDIDLAVLHPNHFNGVNSLGEDYHSFLTHTLQVYVP